MLILDALNDIVRQATSEILKLYFLFISPAGKWSQEQAWTLVKTLSTNPQVAYDAILLDPIFDQNETPIHELTQAELISIESTVEGRPAIIKPGRPVFSAAFTMLVNDKTFNAKMELGRLAVLAGEEEKKIEKVGEELGKFKHLPATQVKEVESRIRYLLNKIQESQRNIDQFEREKRKLKEVLKT